MDIVAAMNYEKYFLIIKHNGLDFNEIKDRLRNFTETEPIDHGRNLYGELLIVVCCNIENLTLLKLSIDIVDIIKYR